MIHTESTAIWTSKPDDGRGFYVAAFNLADQEQTLAYDWTKLGLPKATYAIRDLWDTQDIGTASALKVTLRPHASVLYRVVAEP